MLLYLLRHADAVAQAPSDAERTLTARGTEQAKRAGHFCRRHEIVPDAILCSPLRRAEQTAGLLAAEIGGVKVRATEFLASGMQPDVAVTELRALSQFNKVMLVGHEPDLSSLAAKLLHAPAGKIRLGNATLVAIQLDAGRVSNGILLFSIPVEMMSS